MAFALIELRKATIQLVSKNQFVICKERFLLVDDVPQTISPQDQFRRSGGQCYDQSTCEQKCLGSSSPQWPLYLLD
ncbi:SCAN domain-containing protein 3-like [Aphis craccivora]|uniref:SCAN domain-containing protein 3-like n=1 Tax=Aphis craccivora TaxID=307492 RepID=A0A6G0YIA9_APHCR|nr:SCAN domain-containing protein 3-like [Aphis craccivora]